MNASNGVIYLADEIRYDNTETWNKPISVECEEQEGRVTGSYTSIYTRTVGTNSGIGEISGNRYIEVQPTNTSAQPYVTFDIPDVLSVSMISMPILYRLLLTESFAMTVPSFLSALRI